MISIKDKDFIDTQFTIDMSEFVLIYVVADVFYGEVFITQYKVLKRGNGNLLAQLIVKAYDLIEWIAQDDELVIIVNI